MTSQFISSMDVPSFASDSESLPSSPATPASFSTSQLRTRLMGTMNFFTTHPFFKSKPREFLWFLFLIGRGHVRGQLLCRLPINFELRLQPRLCDACQTLSELLPLLGL